MDFTKLAEYLDTLHEVNVPGCDMVIYRDHEPIFRHMAGFRDEAGTIPVQGDELYFLYSCTKLFTTCAAMQLIGKNKLWLDDPVSWYLPAYERMTVQKGDEAIPCSRVMTIRHLMSMQSGMDYETASPQILEIVRQKGEKASTREIVDAMAARPLCFEPGTDFLYSLSHDVLAAVIEAVSGQRFSEYLKEHIFEPLGLKNTGFSLPEGAESRLCAQYEVQDDTGELKKLPAALMTYKLSECYESGGAGLSGDVQDFITFADAIACGGTGSGGEKILPPEMIQLWSSNQLGPEARKHFDEWNRRGYSYGMGVRTRVDLTTGGSGQAGEFGWDGAAGSWVMIDPFNRLSAFFAMHVKNHAYVYDVVHPTIRSLLYEGL